jgi:hypothetical protein
MRGNERSGVVVFADEEVNLKIQGSKFQGKFKYQD